tara:strand:+ start:1213 stop:1476 length:264 start_codon:yes stop_codon:yes gene_type:complete
MNPRRMTPAQMRVLCSRKQLQEYVGKRLSSLNKRSVASWNNRNEKSGRAKVNLEALTMETLIYIASALNKSERISATPVSEPSESEE